MSGVMKIGLVLMMVCPLLPAQSLLGEINQEHDPARRTQLALVLADESFDRARDFYQQGLMEKGDASLEKMTSALSACVDSLSLSNKSKFYKKAELKVAFLQRRMNDLVGAMSVEERGWAEQSMRRVEEIHDKILDGVMRK